LLGASKSLAQRSAAPVVAVDPNDWRIGRPSDAVPEATEIQAAVPR
jgi:hypothetical protein